MSMCGFKQHLIVYIMSVVIFLFMLILSFFFFFKQKTAYEMRISDWSSDVCSSDLVGRSAPVAYVKNAIATNDAVRMLALYLIRGIEFDIATAKGDVRRFALDTVLTSILRCFQVGIVACVEVSSDRSEERGFGKEVVRRCRSRWSRYYEKNNN